jgi:hypothetical protein
MLLQLVSGAFAFQAYELDVKNEGRVGRDNVPEAT